MSYSHSEQIQIYLIKTKQLSKTNCDSSLKLNYKELAHKHDEEKENLL